MPNYENGKVYCIRSHATVGCYVGSTTQQLSKRFHEHKKTYIKWCENNNLKYTSSFKVLEHGVDDCYIELIENVSCNDKNELERREGEIMRITDNCVNKNILGRTNEERKEWKKEWKEDNKEKYLEYHKNYYNNNKDKMKAQIKITDNINKDKRKEYLKQYYQKKKAEKAQ